MFALRARWQNVYLMSGFGGTANGRTDVIGLMMRRWLTPVAFGIAGGMASGVLTTRALGALIGGAVQLDIVVAAMSLLPSEPRPWCLWRVLRDVELTETLRYTA